MFVSGEAIGQINAEMAQGSSNMSVKRPQRGKGLPAVSRSDSVAMREITAVAMR